MSANRTHLSHWIQPLKNMPLDIDDIKAGIKDGIKRAKADGESKIVSWAGCYDVICHPSGSFGLIATSNIQLFELSNLSSDHIVAAGSQEDISNQNVDWEEVFGIPESIASMSECIERINKGYKSATLYRHCKMVIEVGKCSLIVNASNKTFEVRKPPHYLYNRRFRIDQGLIKEVTNAEVY